MPHITQEKLIIEFYQNNPDRDIPDAEIVDWVTAEYKRRTGKVFRDPDRAIRKLHQQGMLIKVAVGVYRYNPDSVVSRELEDFTEAQKKEILKRDGYRCVICGRGLQEGAVLHMDHIIPKDLGGRATIENGQTLCSQHKFPKKNLTQTETGKEMFIRLYELAKKEKNQELLDFSTQVLQVYEKNNMNGHIIWKH